ncbi:MAG: DUF3500 domain-containing protein, partial [Sweet potato little leaf phytoplasma]|nr:DUF3500 domain-containing protein [Sweet potato little leaf phytoplasma]
MRRPGRHGARHRAEDVLLGRTVAIKLLRPELEGATTSSRARSEMTVLASLNHPALVTLYDAQLAPGRAEYLVMEFVDGPTLAARIAVLGDLVESRTIMNEFSYNFVLFGRPLTNQPWGFSFYGHHLCLNVFLYKTQMVISPWFTGAEPILIDDGP